MGKISCTIVLLIMHPYSFLPFYVARIAFRALLSILDTFWKCWYYVWFDRYKTELYCANHGASRNMAANGPEGLQTLALRDFIVSRCPSLLRGFRSSWLLFNGHLQTAYSVFGDFSDVDRVTYDRKLLRLVDGGTISLDFTPPPNVRPLADDTPIIVAFHGMTGGSYEPYLRSILAPACASVAEGGLGYRAVVINFRGCAGTPVTSDQLYHCGTTDDARQAIMYIVKRYPRARLLGIGFSLGANVLIRYLAQEGQGSRLTAGCALGCPWDLRAVSSRLTNGAWTDRIYSRALAQNLLNLVKGHSIVLARNTAFAQVMPEILSLKSPSLWEFDTLYTSQHASYTAPFPFPGAKEYYLWASSHNVLADVCVPLLAINADDDPIVQDLPRDVGGNELIALAVTKGGGHLGWFMSGRRWWRGEQRRWVKEPVLEWLRAVAEDLHVECLRGRPLCTVDGFISEVGREDIGCREIQGGSKIADGVVRDRLFAGL